MTHLFRNLTLLSVASLLTFTLTAVEEQKDIRRIHAHLLVNDPTSAIEEARMLLRNDTSHKSAWEAYILALSTAGEERRMLQAWSDYTAIFPEEEQNREVLENIAWGVLKKASQSSSPIIRGTAMMGAAFSQDAKGVAFVKTGLQDSNSLIRAVSVQLTPKLRDAQLQEAVLGLFHHEKNWAVRLEAIKAVGALEIKKAKPHLIAIAANDKSTHEEQAVAVEALVNLMDTADRKSIERLSQSRRAGLRLLACQAVSYFNLTDDLDLIVPLTQDSHAEIRAVAIRTIGFARVTEIDFQSIAELAQKLLGDTDDTVAVSAAWLLMLHDQDKGRKAFARIFRRSSPETTRLAAAALAATGDYGVAYAEELLQNETDHFVKMNLAVGLIGQRRRCDEACRSLSDGLRKEMERWMWREVAGFRVLSPSDLRYAGSRLQDPITINQVTRLEVLNLLAMMRYPKTQEAIKHFLQERQWGVTGMASVLLLTEGDDEAVDLVEQLLDDPNRTVRVQAALILSLWGQRESALTALKKAYPLADRETKEKILESMGRLGTEETIPFLMQKLEEPYQTLRLIAASSLLQCLYH